MNIVGIIPARYASTRFPGKPLTPILGKPMVLYVAELTAKALGRENVYVATESDLIKQTVEEAGFQALMTSSEAPTGTDRLWEAAQQVQADIYLNIQGDEPILDPSDITRIAQAAPQYPNHVLCGMAPCADDEDPNSVNIPKVITTESGRLIYMSRLAIPGSKSSDNRPKNIYKQVCIYAFTYAHLKQYGEFGRKSYIESFEDIEILRFFEFGTPIQMIRTYGNSRAVDIPEDVNVIESLL